MIKLKHMSKKRFLRYNLKPDSLHNYALTLNTSLVDFHIKSFSQFLQKNIPADERKNIGLQEIMTSFFPIINHKPGFEIHFIKYEITSPTTSIEECILKGATYACYIRVLLRTVDKSTKEEKEMWVNMGHIPQITDNATFIVNGNERALVPQVQRCPGIIFSEQLEPNKSQSTFLVRIHPFIGSWLQIEIDSKGLVYLLVDKKKKFLISSFLFALPYNSEEKTFDYGVPLENIINSFYNIIEVNLKNEFWTMSFDVQKNLSNPVLFDIYNMKNELIITKGKKITSDLIDKFENQISIKSLEGLFLGEIFCDSNGVILFDLGSLIKEDCMDYIKKNNKTTVKVLEIDDYHPNYIAKTIIEDNVYNREQALINWANSMKISSHYNPLGLSKIFKSRFFDTKYYSLGKIGRERINKILNLNETNMSIGYTDIIAIIKELIKLATKQRESDDVDNIMYRKVRPCGETIGTWLRTGMLKFERNVKDRIYSTDLFNNLNMRLALFSVIDEFHRSHLSQMLEQYNYLSSAAHLRKIYLVGKGGLGNKDHVSDQIRDIHESQLSRICGQTSEGQNTGLIHHLAILARINDDGLLESPVHPVINGIPNTKEIIYLSPFEEKDKIISSIFDYETKNGKLVPKSTNLVCKKNASFRLYDASTVDYMIISNNQIYSISSSLIPFPAYNDPLRTLIAANMNSQAIPLIKPEAPFVGTGMEFIVGKKIFAKNAGVVKLVDAKRIVIEGDRTKNDSMIDWYDLSTFTRTNGETNITEIPLVNPGEYVEAGDIIADGFSSSQEELAIGTNLLVLLQSHPQCYEDGIVMSQNVIHDDKLSSVTIHCLELQVVDTRFGPEQHTRNIGGVPDSDLTNIDEYGIIKCGVYVKENDILVGKITPKSDTAITPEQSLLLSIFGNKATEYTNTSLYSTIPGKVIDVKILTRKGVIKDARAILQDKLEADAVQSKYEDQVSVARSILNSKINKILEDKKSKAMMKLNIESMSIDDLLKIKDPLVIDAIDKYMEFFKKIEAEKKSKLTALRYGYELADGVLKTIKIFIAQKKLPEVGDKLTGRYANKGVISQICPAADMPFLADGAPVEIILSSLGIFARMNIGIVFETTMGHALRHISIQIKRNYRKWMMYKNPENLKELTRLINIFEKWNPKTEEDILDAAKQITENGLKITIPQFHEPNMEEINEFLRQAGVDEDGKTEVFDGKTGEKLYGRFLCGYKFIMKLCHMVSTKIHSRSTGPYSIVYCQPLSGRSRDGGQKFGEMEGWAIEAHGATSILHEMLTAKSDDLEARKKMYNALVNGKNYSLIFDNNSDRHSNSQVSFDLLRYELRGAGFSLEFMGE